ncbi:hypothetical protein C8R44DRAFT_801037 [Mycena epipterygia]|nr:hypothetical protein C8R44DRAFT_801037 [Mycena epipterygia]
MLFCMMFNCVAPVDCLCPVAGAVFKVKHAGFRKANHISSWFISRTLVETRSWPASVTVASKISPRHVSTLRIRQFHEPRSRS